MSVIQHNALAPKRAPGRTFLLAVLVMAAWLALAVWTLSPYAIWLDHGHMGEIEASLPVRVAVFAIGWTLMVLAMMLPGTVPLLAGKTRIAPIIAGWVAVWLGFGALAYLGDNVLHAISHHAPALAWIIAPALLLVAGIYQRTSIKQSFLARCRPKAVEARGIGHTGIGHTEPELEGMRARWILGVRHGVNCVGSCWALMLLMMAFGGMNLVGMLILGAIMTAERLTRHGKTLALAIGVALLVAAVVMVAFTAPTFTAPTFTAPTVEVPHPEGHTH